MAGERPMQRLLMGEVGSGKTVVALHAMLRAAEAGHQAALMAPTETLAEQHMITLDRLLGGLVPIGLLTGSTPAARRREILGRLASGELSLVVGTHALIEPTVEFRVARASRSSTSSTASACASARRSTRRRRTVSRRTCCT